METYNTSAQKILAGGIDAPFKRQKNGDYISENGLTVRFDKRFSTLYGKVFHTSSDLIVMKLNNWPLPNMRDALQASQELGAKYDFNQPLETFEEANKSMGAFWIDTNPYVKMAYKNSWHYNKRARSY